jgi:hypothetical protein
MTARDEAAKAEPFERAKLPMILAAVGVAGGLAIAGSVERTAGGAIVLGAWVLGIASLHRLGRAGSVNDRHQAAGEGQPAAHGDDAPAVDDKPAARRSASDEAPKDD